MLRKKGVVEKFVEFFGDGLANLPLADRATIANMAPEYGSTCGIFPIDEETLRYLDSPGRPPEQIALVEAYAKAQGMWRVNGAKPADYTDVLELDLATVEPSLAGPKRPQDRVPLSQGQERLPGGARRSWPKSAPGRIPPPPVMRKSSSMASSVEIRDGAVTIAAITSCTNTSNPYVLHGRRPAGAQRRKARPEIQALGEDQPCPGFARGHRLSDQGRVVRPAGVHRLQCRRLRLHHLHRQFGAAQAGNLRRHQDRRHRRHLGAVGQPQFRRARAPGSEDELPRFAAAGGGIRARRHHGRGSAERRARHRARWQTGAARQPLAL